MSFRHGKDIAGVFGSTSFVGRMNTLTISWTKELADSTMFDDDGHRFTPGLEASTMAFGGGFEPDTNTAMKGALAGSSPTVVTAAPAGLAHGQWVAMAQVRPNTYAIESPVADLVTFSTESQVENTAAFGRSIKPLAAATESGNGSTLDNSASSANGGTATLHVTAGTGVTPTLDVIVQHSVDSDTWVDLITFDQITETGSEWATVTGTVNRYVRLLWTISGTSPSFTFTAAFARH